MPVLIDLSITLLTERFPELKMYMHSFFGPSQLNRQSIGLLIVMLISVLCLDHVWSPERQIFWTNENHPVFYSCVLQLISGQSIAALTS